MPVRVLPDAEQVVIDYLLGQADVTAILGDDDRVHSQVPDEPVYPLVTVRRLGGSPVVREHLDVALLQIDCYADTKPVARDVAATILAALYDASRVSHPLAVVCDVVETRGLTWLPDTIVPSPRPRYSFDVEVKLHPIP